MSHRHPIADDIRSTAAESARWITEDGLEIATRTGDSGLAAGRNGVVNPVELPELVADRIRAANDSRRAEIGCLLVAAWNAGPRALRSMGAMCVGVSAWLARSVKRTAEGVHGGPRAAK
jgi:hypothetical protein